MKQEGKHMCDISPRKPVTTISVRVFSAHLRAIVLPLRAIVLLCAVLLPLIGTDAYSQANSRLRENLGPMINSENDEVLPVISPDGKTLYFVRKDDPKNVGGRKDDIWFSIRDADGNWGKAANIGSPLNNPGFNFVCTVMPDNNALLLGNHYMTDGSQRQGVSMSFRSDGSWGFPINFFIKDFKNTSDLSEYTLSPDGKVLIMSIKGEDTQGERDMYICFLEDNNMWSKPKNLGEVLNSKGTDITPFIAADGLTMYFSSDRPGGFGSNDAYMTRRLDDSWLNWSRPRNLGWPINTPDWDAYYTVPANGEYAYFVSTSEGFGKSDIFRIILPENVRPTPVLMVSGIVKDIHGNIVPATIVYERLSDNKAAGTAFANPETGEYTIALPKGYNYGFHADAEGYYPISENIDLTDLSQFDEIRRDLILAPITMGATVRLNNIFFDFDEATLRPESFPELDRLVRFLESRLSMVIEVQGHTDSKGGDMYNLKLSRNRAKSVMEYLLKESIAPLRLISKGYGEGMPIATNETDEGRQMNRRVEYKILEE